MEANHETCHSEDRDSTSATGTPETTYRPRQTREEDGPDGPHNGHKIKVGMRVEPSRTKRATSVFQKGPARTGPELKGVTGPMQLRRFQSDKSFRKIRNESRNKIL